MGRMEPMPRNWIGRYLRAHSAPWSGECFLPPFPLAEDEDFDDGGCSHAGAERPLVVKVGLSALLSKSWKERNLSC